MLVKLRRTRSLLNSVRCSAFLRTSKQWLKWSSKAEVQKRDTHPEPTELLLTSHVSSTSCRETMATMTQEERRRENCGKVKTDVDSCLACCDKFFHCAKSNCNESPGILRALCQQDWKSTGKLVARERNQDAAVEFSSVAKRCRDGQENEGTRRGRKGPGTSEFVWKLAEYEETRSVRKLGHRLYRHSLTTQSP